MFLHNTVSPVWAESAGKLNLGREIFTAPASLLRLEFQYRTVCSRQTAQPLPSITIKPHIESYCNSKMRVCLRRPEICLYVCISQITRFEEEAKARQGYMSGTALHIKLLLLLTFVLVRGYSGKKGKGTG